MRPTARSTLLACIGSVALAALAPAARAQEVSAVASSVLVIPDASVSEAEASIASIGLRRGMKEAIACEDYEKAKEDRDAIRGIEDRWLGAPAS